MHKLQNPRIFYSLAVILFWYPVYESLHQGQITLVLTALLAAAIHRDAFWRGLLIGLVVAIKPTFILLLPFAAFLFGWRCVMGMMFGILPAVIAWDWFIEYVKLFPKISQRDYLMPSPAGLIGVMPSAVLSCILSGIIVWRVKEKEWAYLLVIGVISVCTALWIHSHTPAVLPVLYGINRFWKVEDNLPSPAGTTTTRHTASKSAETSTTASKV